MPIETRWRDTETSSSRYMYGAAPEHACTNGVLTSRTSALMMVIMMMTMTMMIYEPISAERGLIKPEYFFGLHVGEPIRGAYKPA